MSNQGTPPTPPSSMQTLANRGIQPRFGELVQSCRKLVMNRLAEHLTGVFAQVDDTLFECAEKAENNQVQTLFFDNMREIRKQRPQIERSYHKQIAQNLSDFLEGTLKPPASASELDVEQMALVQNEDYEESLQVTNMVSRVKARCAQPLFALEQRLALLNNGQKLGEDSNPFGPQMIAQAFRDALAPCPFPLRIKVILYTLFDTHVMQSLDNIYSALNQRLIEAGVLPNLKYSAQRNNQLARPKATPAAAQAEQPAESSRSVSSGAGQQHNAGNTDLSGPPPSDPLELLGSLATLLSEHRQRDIDAPLLGGTRSIASFTPREATSTYSASALLDALNRMQQHSASDLSQRLHHPQQVEGLKADLQQQLEAHSALPGQQKVSDQEADVIDLVGMLFDFILDDDNLPDTCKTTLSHLHTPYLKVALQDKALFTQHHHPARRLLNSMAQAGVLYGSEGDERGLLAKMQWVVERVIHDFLGDLQLFDGLLEEFNEFVGTLRHKVELRERRAVEAAKGRDKLLGARQNAVEVIANSLSNRQPPSIIRNFLELTWADVLVFVLLRNGERSPEWQSACEAAEQLAWSGTLLDEAGRERLQKLRVPLLEDLRKGLELLGGYHEAGIRRLLQDLVACQHAVQAKQPQVAAKLQPSLPESPLAAMLGEDAALATQAPRESTLSARAQALAKELGHIEFGTWFEFVTGEQVRLLKLSWFSPTTRNYMFVDQSGQRVAIKPLTQLATEMEQGLARIVTPERGAPLVDRALTAIYRVLQRFTGRTAESQE
ncbi:Protein of unknown function [Pseudomonas guineae]|uniref:Thymidine phosphorylase n=1 Tax=Pseudomonas guineae TaxID=425504 RepID=A0A1I3EAK2_9PSED|nr:DUF1631 domain-containing protein [Pseudomonas guineae]SFH96020.1 Protein of unknown function [Pseudomonas guineae]